MAGGCHDEEEEAEAAVEGKERVGARLVSGAKGVEDLGAGLVGESDAFGATLTGAAALDVSPWAAGALTCPSIDGFATLADTCLLTPGAALATAGDDPA